MTNTVTFLTPIGLVYFKQCNYHCMKEPQFLCRDQFLKHLMERSPMTMDKHLPIKSWLTRRFCAFLVSSQQGSGMEADVLVLKCI